MPSFDRILQISEPTGMESFAFDYGHNVTAWYGFKNEIVEGESRKRAIGPQGGPIRARSVARGDSPRMTTSPFRTAPTIRLALGEPKPCPTMPYPRT